MSMSEIHKQMEHLFSQYNLGILIKDPETVTGGLLHKMYKVTTRQKVYAVKWLNPSIMEREGVLTNMMNSERIATEVSKHLPVISALEVDNQHVLHVADEYYIVFDWLEGVTIFPPHITTDNCYAIGSLLGKLHRLNITIPCITKEVNEVPMIDWLYYLNLGEQEKVEWLDIYSKAIPNISSWNFTANHSIHALSENQVISHRDLDPKNVLWHMIKSDSDRELIKKLSERFQN